MTMSLKYKENYQGEMHLMQRNLSLSLRFSLAGDVDVASVVEQRARSYLIFTEQSREAGKKGADRRKETGSAKSFGEAKPTWKH